MRTIAALILLFGQQTVYQFVRLFLFFFYQTVIKLQTFWIPKKFNASRKYKPSVLQSVHFIYTCRRTWMQHASWRTKIPAVAAMGRPYRLYL